MPRARINRQGVATFLKSPEMRALIDRKTVAVADAAAAASSARGDFAVDLETGEQRVRGAVMGDYTTSDPEVSRAALLRGLDGARGAD